MLRGINKASSNWLGKAVLALVMGVLAISFAIWGIGDIFRGFGRSTVAKIGGTEITIEQFRVIYNDRLQQFGRQTGRPVTPDLARQLGLDRQIVGQLVAEAALDERVRQLGLNLSDEEVARQIMGDAAFRGPTGGFDRLRFEQLIRNAGYSEIRYTQEQRRQALRRQLAGSVGGDVVLPKTALEAVNRYQNESRAVSIIVLTGDQAGEIAAPAPEVLKTYYDEHKVAFRAPEYRAVTLLSVTPADLASWITVADEDAKRIYEDRAARYVVPERRHLLQMVFPNDDEAKVAAARIAAGESFAAIAAERNLSEKDFDLGPLTRAQMVDRAVAEAAFGLKQGETSAPVAGRFGSVLVQAKAIEPEQVRPFEAVAGELKQELAMDRARSEVQTRHDKIEDDRAAGLRLDEIAKKFGMEARAIAAVDRSGHAPSGEVVGDLPRGTDVVAQAFATQVGVEADPIQLTGGGYLWFDVLSIQPSRERSFDEVAERVEQRWRQDQQAVALKAKAATIVDTLKAGTPPAQAAAGVEPRTLAAVKRASRDLPPRVVDAVFRAEKGVPESVEGDNPAERIVFTVTDIAVPAFDPAAAEARQLSTQLKRALSEDLVAEYVARLEQDFGTSVNSEALNQVVGGGGERY